MRFHQFPQLAFGNGKRRNATVEANQHLWKEEDPSFVQILVVRKMDVDLSGENTQIVRCTGLTLHKYPTKLPVWVNQILTGWRDVL